MSNCTNIIYTKLLFCCLALSACQTTNIPESTTALPAQAPSFEKISSFESGLSFSNVLIPDIETKENLFDFDFFYNGAGVGIGDINNDGLQDIFFCGNQVENKLYLNQGNLKFKDVSEDAGINNGKQWSNGVTFADVNEDGWLDIYVSQGGAKEAMERKNLLFINQKDNSFKESAIDYGLADEGISTQAAFFDYDKDGDLDCIVANENELYGVDPIRFFRVMGERSDLKWKSSSHLYENRDGKFVDVTKEAGLLKATFGLGLTVSDINDDGWLDIYIANDYYVPDNLYINLGNGTFRDEAKLRLNQMAFFGMGVDVADVNNDGAKDIFVLDMASSDHYRAKTLMASMDVQSFDLLVNKFELPHQYMFNALQVNVGSDQYQNVAHFGGVAKTDWSWAGLLADFNNDGWKDIFVTNGYRQYGLDNDLQRRVIAAKQEYQGKVPVEVKQELYESMPSEPLANLFYLNQSNLNFSDQTVESGLNQPSFSNGAAYADLDKDGDLDLVVNNIDAEAFLYKNLTNEQAKGNYLRIQLDGETSESFAKVSLFQQGQVQMAESKRTRGYYSATENIIHFGVGQQKVIDTVRVEWQNGRVEERYKIKAGQVLTFKQVEAKSSSNTKITNKSSFQQVSLGELKLLYKHSENEYNDFAKEILLPYKQSTFGPCLAKADVNGDGRKDVFIGGAAGQAGGLFIQTEKGFQREKYTVFDAEETYEDIEALFFDADSDGDQDLFVVSGGNAFPAIAKEYENRLYLNDGAGIFARSPQQFSSFSGGKAIALDYDKDGDLDLIEGNRILPQQYPQSAPSFIYQNENGKFKVVTETVAPEFSDLGIINDLIVTDFNRDGWQDFIAVGEWGAPAIFVNEKGKFRNITDDLGLTDLKGWYFSIQEMDVNKDGRPDYLIGNVGLNTKFKASQKTPFKVFANDFDENGSYDVVLSTAYKDEYVPVRGRECSSQQMPFIKDKFPTYDAFAKAALPDIYGDKLDSSLELDATEFRSFLLISQIDGTFKIEYLPAVAQQFPTLDVFVRDLDQDGFEDVVLIGNIYNTEVETPRWDAGSGLVLYGSSSGKLVARKNARSELYIDGNVKSLLSIQHNGKDYLVAGRNNDLLRVFEIKR